MQSASCASAYISLHLLPSSVLQLAALKNYFANEAKRATKSQSAILLSYAVWNPPTTSLQKEKMLTSNPCYHCKWYGIP